MLPATTELVVRNYEPATDSLPEELLSGFSLCGDQLDPDWVWVLETEEGICAALIGAPMHGTLFLLRIAATTQAPPMWPRFLLLSAIADAKERGLNGLWTMLDANRKEELRLARILVRAGGELDARAIVLGAMSFHKQEGGV